MSAYAYPPPNHQQNTEAYRASPTGSNVSLPSLNLPPIRTMDGRPQSQQGQHMNQHQSQQQQIGQPQMSAPLPPSLAAYYPGMPGQSLPPPQHMGVTSDPNQQPMRYPLPPGDGRMMSGGRHKKEIKRRTKTGCLTCRKRRIKCDEAHPACRNCQKSKRDCLGYDPIFKSQPGPPAIQPAPSAAPSMQSTPSSATPYPPPPQGYVSASSQPYAPSNPMANRGSPNSASDQQYDYGNAIDPALASSLQSKTNSALFNGADLKRDPSSGSPYAPDGIGKSPRMDELIASETDPHSAPPPIQSLPPASYEDVTLCYQRVYGPQIDKFLETQWFSARALEYVLKDARLCERFASLVSRFNVDPSSPTYHQMLAATKSLEASVIWSIMSTARRVASLNQSSSQRNPEDTSAGVLDAAKRVEILESLLLGQYLDTEAPAAAESARNGTAFQAQLNQREREFWQLLHRFLTIHDDEASASHELDEILLDTRRLLDSKENRDVLYSIAVVRLHGGRENLDNPPQLNHSASHVPDKGIKIAKEFLEGQATGKGTTQVVQRLCGMAVKSWTLPR
ncbi:MAG: hypothetical protein Q9220_003468 [cf. Caloplaca sp. 1 TL-2023]